MKVRRGSSLKLWWTVGLLLIMSAVVSANTAPSLYDYKYDGTTTYCYWMDQGMQVSNFDFAYVLGEGVGFDCPLTITLEQATTGPILPESEVEYTFTATLNLNDNAFNLTELQAVVPDPATGLPMQIGHANIHTCSRATVCDIFRTGSNRNIADQETSNFTNAGTASFRQEIKYSSPGERNVFAHIILPPKDFLKTSYHFITFLTTNVEASTTGAAESGDMGLSTGAIVATIVGAVAAVVIAILSVVFWRRKRRPGQDMNQFRDSGFGLPASYIANKSRSHLDWSAEPDSRAHGSGYKDNFSSEDRSRASRGPGLNASALVFNDRLSRQNKTVSSSGSLHSSRGPGDSGLMYNNYSTPMQRSGHKIGANEHAGRDSFGASHSMYPDDSMYEGESRIVEEDPNLEYGRTPDLETFVIGQVPSFESETSMGSSFEYKTGDSHFPQPGFNPLLNGRDSDLSSMGEHAEYSSFEQQPSRGRDNKMEALPNKDGKLDNENRSSSVSSIGTVDFTQDEPSVHCQKPTAFEPLDETLTMSGMAKAKMAIAMPSGLTNSNASDKTKFSVHNTTNFASTDFNSTTRSVDIDERMMQNKAAELAAGSADTADIVSIADFESSTVTDIVASSEFSASSTGDFTKPRVPRGYDERSSFDSELEGSSYNSGLTSSSFGTDGTGSSYGAGVDGLPLYATKTENVLSNTQSTYDFDDKSFRASDSFVTTASDDEVVNGEGLRPRRVSSADGESYEF